MVTRVKRLIYLFHLKTFNNNTMVVKKTIIIIVQIVIFSTLLLSCVSKKKKELTFQKLLGRYEIDSVRTRLLDYDSLIRNIGVIEIEFRSDSTFIISRKVPFIYDSVGKWVAGDGDPYSLNQMGFKDFNYFKGSHINFINPYHEKGDTLIMIDATLPQKGKKGLVNVFLKKIDSPHTSL